jgi:hypothetical protein
VTALRPDLPPAVDAVLARGLAKPPAARYPSCAAFVAALAAALDTAPSFLDPDELRSRLGNGDLRQTSLTVLVGSAGPIPLTVPLDAGITVLRAGDDVAAAVATWVICQAVAGHPARALCLAAALVPTPSRNWLWLNWLPNARPDTPPLSGPHIATSAEAAAELGAAESALGPTALGPTALGPTVLGVLDTRLGAPPDDPALPGSGIPVLYLARPGDPAPADASTVDVAGGRCRVIVGGRIADGVPDLVPYGYGREVADLLPDS